MRKKWKVKEYKVKIIGGAAKTIIVTEDERINSVGSKVWKSALTLCSYIRGDFEDREKYNSVVDIGCGSGLSGVFCGKELGLETFLVDDINRVDLRIPKETARLNGLAERCKTFDLVWGNYENIKLLEENIPSGPVLIVGSDLFYEPEYFDELLMSITYLLERRHDSIFVTVFKERSSKRNINHLLDKYGLDGICLTPDGLQKTVLMKSTFIALIKKRCL